MPTLESLGIAQMSREDRLSLVQAIWNSLETDGTNPSLLTDSQRAELNKRIAEDDANPDDVVPWEEAKRRILAGLQKPQTSRMGSNYDRSLKSLGM